MFRCKFDRRPGSEWHRKHEIHDERSRYTRNDGRANIEIVAKAGEENNYIFGARVDEIERLRAGDYDPAGWLKANPAWERVVNTLVDGTFSDDGMGIFKGLYDALTVGTSWHKPDHYFIFRDVEEYYQTILRANADYRDRNGFAGKQLANTAHPVSSRLTDRLWNMRRIFGRSVPKEYQFKGGSNVTAKSCRDTSARFVPPGKYGIGTLGEEAYRFVDLLAEKKIRYWQILPLVQRVTGILLSVSI